MLLPAPLPLTSLLTRGPSPRHVLLLKVFSDVWHDSSTVAGVPYLDVLAAFRNDLRVLANSWVEQVSDYLGTYLAVIDVWTLICGPALMEFLLFIAIIFSFHAIMGALFFVARAQALSG